MKWVAVFAVWLLSPSAFGIANSEKFSEAETRLAKDGDSDRAKLLKHVAQAVGLVVMIDENPVVESQDQQKRDQLGFQAFKQEQCGAVYFQEPAYFVTAAHCFLGADGKLDRFRRYAKLVMQGDSGPAPAAQAAQTQWNGYQWVSVPQRALPARGYQVDPLSIVIHPKHSGNSNPTEYDVAIFSLLPEQIDGFAKSHKPIKIAPPESWFALGQRFYLAGFGGLSASGEGWGDGRIKPFKLVNVPKADQAKGDSRLFVSPQEKILLLATENNRPGINCLFDSGGAALAESFALDGSLSLHLAGNISRKTGPDGNAKSDCDQVNRYAIATDLRYKREWLAEAVLQSIRQKKEAEQFQADFTSLQSELYGKNSNPYTLWVRVRVENLVEMFATMKALTNHEKSKSLYEYMLREKKLQEAIAMLSPHSNAPQSVQNVVTLIQRPADPFRSLASNQVEGVRDARQGDRYLNPRNYVPVRSVRVINLSDKPLSFDSIGGPYGTASKEEKVVLNPGQKYTLTVSDNYLQLKQMDHVQMRNLRGDNANIKVDFTLATEGELMQLLGNEVRQDWYYVNFSAQHALNQHNASKTTLQNELYNLQVIRSNQFNNRAGKDVIAIYDSGIKEVEARRNRLDEQWKETIKAHKAEVDKFNQKWNLHYRYVIQ